jgi:hypothetical protein
MERKKASLRCCPQTKTSHIGLPYRSLYGDVANRTISKTGHLDRHVGNRTVSKLQAICNSSGQEVLFPLYGVFMFENYANYKI